MKNEFKGFSNKHIDSEKVDRALSKVEADLKENIDKFKALNADPAGRGAIDAILGKPCASDEPSYVAAYEQNKMTQLLASPEERKMIQSMQPILRKFLKEAE